MPTPTFPSLPTCSLAPLASVPSSHRQQPPPSQRGGFKSGGQAHICVSKVRLHCRMLSFSADGCRVSRMTALTPVGDVWSGMERHGLTEVLGSYRTQCDLNSHWIPGGDKRPQLRGGNQAPWLTLLLLCVQNVSADLLAGTDVFDELCFISGHQLASSDWWRQRGATETKDVYQQQLSDGFDLSLELIFSLKSGPDGFSQPTEHYSFSQGLFLFFFIFPFDNLMSSVIMKREFSCVDRGHKSEKNVPKQPFSTS